MSRRYVPFAALVLAFLATRLYNLLVLPVFLDEAIQIEWGFRTALTGRLTGITDGSRYLPVWLTALVVPWAPDPLLAARLLSVAYGLATVLGLVWVGTLTGDRAAGWLAAALYVVVPFALFHDRLALTDGLLTLLLVGALGASLRWVQTGEPRWALLVGLAVGLGGLTKLNGVWLALIPCAVYAAAGRGRQARPAQLHWILWVALLVLLPALHDLPASMGYVRDNAWVFRAGRQGTSPLLENLGLALGWLGEYLTPVLAALCVLAAGSALRQRNAFDLALVGSSLAWILLLVLTGGVDWFPRYLLPVLPMLLLLVARRVNDLARSVAGEAGWSRHGRWLPPAVMMGVTLAALPFDRALFVDPQAAPLPGIDRWQYVEDWPSGYGVREVARTLVDLDRRPGGVLVLRDAWAGPMHESLDLALADARPEILSTAFRYDAFHGVVERILTEARPAVLVVEQPVQLLFVLEAGGGRVVPPAERWPKPGIRRESLLYVIHGEAEVNAPPAAATGLPAATQDWSRRRAAARLAACTEARGRAGLESCREALAGLRGDARAEALFTVSSLLVVEGRLDDALGALEEADRLVPYDADQIEALGHVLDRLGRHRDALGVWERAERAGCPPATVELQRGWNQGWLGAWDDAEAAFRRGLEHDRSAAGLNNLAVALWLRGQSDDAVANLIEAQRLTPEALRIRYNLAVMRAARKRATS